MRKSTQKGFTVVELLVVIAIIAMLVAILLPAVGAARAQARNMRCKSRIRQIALAAQAYDTRNNSLPGYVSLLRTTDSDNRQASRPVSWFIQMAPDIDQAPIQDQWKIKYDSPNQLPRSYIPSLACPSDPTLIDTLPALSYMANAGRAVTRARQLEEFNKREYGVFLNEALPGNPKNSLSYVNERDGTSRTIMFAENIQLANQHAATRWDTPGPQFQANKESTVIVWQNEEPNSANARMLISGDNDYKVLESYTARPASFHNGGANIAFCGQNVNFLADDIAYRVYVQLMIPDDKGAIRRAGKKDPLVFWSDIAELEPLSESEYAN